MFVSPMALGPNVLCHEKRQQNDQDIALVVAAGVVVEYFVPLVVVAAAWHEESLVFYETPLHSQDALVW
jgi:hypothetical protein